MPVMDGLDDQSACLLDFTPNNGRLAAIDVSDTEIFEEYVWQELKDQGKRFGVGGYFEWREIYRRSRLFDGTDEAPRNVHLGVDIWAPAALPVYSPIDGKVHSIKDNAGFGNYGGTIVIEHRLTAATTLYCLYGHLGTSYIQTMNVGQAVSAGDKVGELGGHEENGHWPPHLHFQLMTDMQGNIGDFPGVCAMEERGKYAAICPNPNLLLRLETLANAESI